MRIPLVPVRHALVGDSAVPVTTVDIWRRAGWTPISELNPEPGEPLAPESGEPTPLEED